MRHHLHLLLLSFLLIGIGCSDSDDKSYVAAQQSQATPTTTASSSATSEQGELSVLITDAPLRDLSLVTKAEITVEKVQIHAAAVTSASGTASVTSANPNSNAGGQGAANRNPNAGANGIANRNPNAGANPNAGGANAPGRVNAHGQNPNAKGGNPSAQANRNPNAAQNGQGNNAGGQANAPGGQAGQGGQSGGSFITLFDAAASGAPKTYNLLDLRGGIMAEITNAQLPAGKYTHIVISISAAELVHGGVSYSTANGLLESNAAMRSGLKVPFPGQHAIVIQAGQPAQVLLDFDLSRSFNSKGPPQNPTSYTLLPVIRGANMRSSGYLAGVTLSDYGTPNDTADDVPLPNTQVTATQGNASVTAFADAQGIYRLAGLGAGDWEVTFTETAHNDLVQTVTIARRQQTTLDVTLVKK